MAPCYARDCNSGQWPDGIQTFPFPTEKPEFAQWIDFIGKPATWKLSRYARLCMLHFEESCFEIPAGKKKRYLVDGAVPTIHASKVGKFEQFRQDYRFCEAAIVVWGVALHMEVTV